MRNRTLSGCAAVIVLALLAAAACQRPAPLPTCHLHYESCDASCNDYHQRAPEFADACASVLLACGTTSYEVRRQHPNDVVLEMREPDGCLWLWEGCAQIAGTVTCWDVRAADQDLAESLVQGIISESPVLRDAAARAGWAHIWAKRNDLKCEPWPECSGRRFEQ